MRRKCCVSANEKDEKEASKIRKPTETPALPLTEAANLDPYALLNVLRY